MQNNDNNSRKDFLIKFTLAIGSIFVLSGFNFKKVSDNFFRQKFKTLSEPEANEIIKNSNSPALMQLKPAPAPVGQNNLK